MAVIKLAKVIAVVGPTAVGKTGFSIELAKQFNSEIISGDSMQIYRGLDIGTAKVTVAEMAGVQHHLIDFQDPAVSFSAADFQKKGRLILKDLHDQGKIPIIAGGTGLYLKSLLYDLHLGGTQNSQPEEAAASGLRQKYEQLAAEKGAPYLWALLNEKDPAAAQAVHVNNVRRLIRVLEVIELTGRPFSEQQIEEIKPLYDVFFIGLTAPRPLLYQRINQRVEHMFEAGLLEEATRLFQLKEARQAQNGIGYREFRPYFAGTADLATVKETIQKDSRHYAKRQLTWFKHQVPTKWYDLLTDQQARTKVDTDLVTWLAE